MDVHCHLYGATGASAEVSPAGGGISYEDVLVGDGPVVDRGSVVEIRYDLFLNRGDPIQSHEHVSFWLGDRETIAGLRYGVEGMRKGGRRLITVSPHLAYGDRGVPGSIPSNAALKFEVTLLKVGADD
ncbi:MAG: FKBP-type peptidyl-prolyl cis-trans isomerase [Planctomycetota bacterium]